MAQHHAPITKQQRRKKYIRKDSDSDESYANGFWTESEHERFIEGVRKYGKLWRLVFKHVRTRSTYQVRSHAQKFFFYIKRMLDQDLMQQTSENTKAIFNNFDTSQPIFQEFITYKRTGEVESVQEVSNEEDSVYSDCKTPSYKLKCRNEKLHEFAKQEETKKVPDTYMESKFYLFPDMDNLINILKKDDTPVEIKERLIEKVDNFMLWNESVQQREQIIENLYDNNKIKKSKKQEQKLGQPF